MAEEASSSENPGSENPPQESTNGSLLSSKYIEEHTASERELAELANLIEENIAVANQLKSEREAFEIEKEALRKERDLKDQKLSARIEEHKRHHNVTMTKIRELQETLRNTLESLRKI